MRRETAKQPAAKAGCSAAPCSALPPVLDACCGGKAMWFDSEDDRAIFVDRREEEHMLDRGEQAPQHLVVAPDIVADFTNLPFPDESFWHVVFDPPHCNRCSETGWLAKKYGKLIAGWEEMLEGGFEECFRVLKPNGTLIFKWSSVQIPLSRVLPLAKESPLYGHRSGANMKTHWISFLKLNSFVMPSRGNNVSTSTKATSSDSHDDES